MKYKPDDEVWLAAFEEQPREKCRLIRKHQSSGTWIGRCSPQGSVDDGLREFSEDQIESLV